MNYPFELIKKHYEKITPGIHQAFLIDPSKWYEPYCKEVDWVKIFSPIEINTWDDIRGYGLVPLYPQYPVGKYFVDFGHPFLKIAIECDGQDFHKDKNRDQHREEEIRSLGWTVFRISGSDCKKFIYPDEYSEEFDKQLKYYFENTIEGLLRAIHLILILKVEQAYDRNDVDMAIECLIKRSSGHWQP